MNLDSEPSSVELSTFPLLHTKQRPPHTHADWVPRPRLLHLLNAGLTHPVTVVSAPAGFGKTTLLAQWASASSLPCAWITLDAHDNDLTLFLAYLVAGIEGLFPHTCAETAHLLSALRPAPKTFLFTTFINELDAIHDQFILVLDDYQFITDESIHDVLAELALAAPGGLRLVVAARSDPPLPLTKFRARGDLTEIRAAELRFTESETQSFLAPVLDVDAPSDVSSEAFNIIGARVEGWVAGLRLTALALQSGQTLDELRTTLKQGGGRFVMEYLLGEVLAGQPSRVQAFLLRTSILDRLRKDLCADLCEATLDEMEPLEPDQFILEHLERMNLFLVRLDDGEGWYRYHHLFRQLLQHELRTRFSREAVGALHRTASVWLARHGFTEEAIRHALTAEDVVGAAVLVEAQVHPLMNQEHWRLLERYLSLLPDDLFQQRPALLVARAYVNSFLSRLAAIPPLLQQAEALLDDPDQPDQRAIHGAIAVLRAQQLYFEVKTTEGALVAQRAIDDLPATALYARSGAFLYRAMHHHLAGRGDEGIRVIEQIVEMDPSLSATVDRLLLTLCLIYQQNGQLDQVLMSARRLLAAAQANHHPLGAAWAHYFLGSVAYVRNDLDEAVEHFLRVSERRYHAHALSVRESLLGLALSFQAQGRVLAAQEVVEDLTDYALETQNAAARSAAEGLRARLAIARGANSAALSLLASLDSPPAPLVSLDPLPLIQARILLAQRTAESRAQATERLATLRHFAEITHNTWHLHSIGALQALVAAEVGKRDDALALLRHALQLAQPHGIVRPFAEAGSGMDDLVRALQGIDGTTPYLDRLVAACVTNASEPRALALTPDDIVISIPVKATDIVTTREIVVLRLLDQRLTDKEIAQTLVISSFTVHTHTRNIFRKLRVNNRQAAVTTARAMGILA
jgi:LuxR family transcriptional regulator, maltose regulon positive regulatory protein